MKKTLAILLLAAVAFGAKAQGYQDAFRYSQQFPVGTARTVAMGNAFTALGCDLGAMGINPASTALYNCCEFAVTPALTFNSTNSETGYSNPSNQDARGTKFGIPNVSVVFAMPTGRTDKLVSWSFGVGLNKVNNFNSHISYAGQDGTSSLLGNIACGLEGIPSSVVNASDGYDAGNLPWQSLLAWDNYLVDVLYEDETTAEYLGATENLYDDGIGVGGDLHKSFDRVTSGAIYNVQMNFGFNFSDELYLGANVNVYTVDYGEERLYSEIADKAGDYTSGFNGMSYGYWQETTGSGINLQLGLIWVPFPAVRFGATYTTPTAYTLSDQWAESMASDFNANNSFGYESSKKTVYPDYPYSYQVKSPARFSLGAAFVLGNRGLVSVDYEHVDYSATRIRDEKGYDGTFMSDNAVLKTFNPCDIVRVGAEFNVNSALALRAGYNSYMFPDPEYQFLSFGFGTKLSETAGLDLAFRTNLGATYTSQPYTDYAGISVVGANVKEYNREVLLTYKVKF